MPDNASNSSNRRRLPPPPPTSLSLTPIAASALLAHRSALLALGQATLEAFPLASAGWQRLADRPGASSGGSSSSSSKVESYRSAAGWAGRRSEHGPAELSWSQAVVRPPSLPSLRARSPARTEANGGG
jgi:hypothetical protein